VVVGGPCELVLYGEQTYWFIEVIARFPTGKQEQVFRAEAIPTWMVTRSLSGSVVTEWMQKAQAAFDIDLTKVSTAADQGVVLLQTVLNGCVVADEDG
jgi:hypothetical protein